MHEPLGRKLIREPLHALAARGSHLGDLRHGQRAKQYQASHEAERTAQLVMNVTLAEGAVVPTDSREEPGRCDGDLKSYGATTGPGARSEGGSAG